MSSFLATAFRAHSGRSEKWFGGFAGDRGRDRDRDRETRLESIIQLGVPILCNAEEEGLDDAQGIKTDEHEKTYHISIVSPVLVQTYRFVGSCVQVGHNQLPGREWMGNTNTNKHLKPFQSQRSG